MIALAAFVLAATVAVLSSLHRAQRARLPLSGDGILASSLSTGAGCAIVSATGAVAHDLALGVALAACAVAAWSDVRTGYIFDAVTFPAGTIVLFCGVASDPAAHLLSLLLASGSLLMIWALTAGRGLGLGDVKLAAVFALAMSPLLAALAVGSAFVIGAVVCIALVATRRLDRRVAVPFGPFLSGGAALAFVYGAHL